MPRTEYRVIPLTQGKSALIDEADYELISQFRWHFDRYPARNLPRSAQRQGSRRKHYLHQELMGEPPEMGLEVDHVNGDKLDNRRSNLRWATRQQQTFNVMPRAMNANKRHSRYKGVTLMKDKYWVAAIAMQHIGLFKTEVEAARAYNEAATARWGEFARLNEIPDA